MTGKFSQWWEKWWEEDYSWDGLAKKDWLGWCVNQNGDIEEDHHFAHEAVPPRELLPRGLRRATLQDYWRDQENDLILVPGSNPSKYFTKVHCPLKWQDGTVAPVISAAEQVSILATRFVAAVGSPMGADRRILGPDKSVQIQGAVLRDFDHETIRTRVRTVSLEIALSANRCYFHDNASFVSTKFHVRTSFRNALFSAKANFHSAEFYGDVSFQNATFCNTTEFLQAKFHENVSFDFAIFLTKSDFRSTRFLREATYLDALFSGDALFDDAQVKRCMLLDRGTFLGATSFKGVEFVGDISLIKAVFAGPARFSGTVAIEGGGAQLLSKRSFKSLTSDGAIFLEEARFDNRDILEPSSFRNTFFAHRASFHGSKLHQGVTFQGANFDAALKRKGEFQPNWLAELNSIYLEQRSSSNFIKKTSATILRRLRNGFALPEVGKRPTWVALRLRSEIDPLQIPEGPTSSAITVHDPSPNQRRLDEESYIADLEDCFRTLKRAMEDNRNRPDENRFFRLELLARRRRHSQDVSKWDKAVSFLYDWTSDFGNSIIRPMGVLILSFFVFASIYANLSTQPIRYPNTAEYTDALNYSFSRGIAFGPWEKEPKPCSTIGRLLDVEMPIQNKSSPNCPSDLLKRYGTSTALGVRMLASFQSLLALLLIFLTALAARRKFQIS